jgi:hypothetical protein
MDSAQETLLTDRQRYWLEHIEACEASGKRVTEYAAEHGLGVRAMYDGKKSLVNKGVLPRTRLGRFQRVQVASVAVDQDWRVQLPNGVSVVFSGTVDARTLTTVLNAAAAVAL